MIFRFFIILLSFWANLSYAQAISNSVQFEQAEQAALYQEMLRIIRCPTCQNQDIAESNAPLAKQLRDLIATQIQAGKNRDEITDYLVERYGDFITYAPRVQKNTLVLWFAPLAVMLLALAFWLGLRKRQNPPDKSLSPEQAAQLQQWLATYGRSST